MQNGGDSLGQDKMIQNWIVLRRESIYKGVVGQRLKSLSKLFFEAYMLTSARLLLQGKRLGSV